MAGKLRSFCGTKGIPLTGSPSALADAVHVGMAANALSKYLNVKSGRLLDEYHVRYENKVRHEGRRITLTYDAESK